VPDGYAHTVLGPVPATDLGAVLMHEHLATLLPGRFLSGGALPDELDLAERAAAPLPARGFRTLVNLTGRVGVGDQAGPAVLQEVSRRTGLHIVAGFGFYTERWFPPGMVGMSLDELTRTFVGAAQGPGVPVGIYGEVASSLGVITGGERRCLRAAARAQQVTGLPIYTHASLGTMAAEQVEILLGEGADPARVVIGHLDLNPDVGAVEQVLRTGVTAGFDTIGKETFDYQLRPEESPEPGSVLKRLCHRPDSERFDTIALLVQRGWAGQIVLSSDMTGHEAYQNPRTHGSFGLCYLPDRALEELRRRGVDQDAIDTMTVRNPARILAG
jgi:phosphotriesterase-related protein